MIQHNVGLIDELKGEHRQLLETFGALKKRGEARDAAGFKQALEEFKQLLMPHLIKESASVYSYLRQHYRSKNELDLLHRVNEYKAEMGGIGDAALKFITLHENVVDEAMDFRQINDSLRAIGPLLGDRISREESDLYHMYQSTV